MSVSRRVIYAVFDDCASCHHRDVVDDLRKMTARVRERTGKSYAMMIVQPGNTRFETLRRAHKYAAFPFVVFDDACYQTVAALEERLTRLG